MIYIPIIGALALAGGTILSKIVLREKKIDIKLFQATGFLAAVLVMLPFLYFFWSVNPQALELKNMIIFLLIIIFSIFANLALFYSMKREKVSNLEPAIVLEPLFTILLAILFSFLIGQELYERNLKVIIPALIAGVTLMLIHIKKHHIEFNKYFLATIAGSFLFALELIFSRLILEYYSPLSFYFIRCSALFLVSLILFHPKFEKLDTKINLKIMAVGALWVAYRVIVYYGYLHLGVVFTTLVIMLGPIFVFLFAWKFLKEKVGWRNILASFVIVACIAYVIIG